MVPGILQVIGEDMYLQITFDQVIVFVLEGDMRVTVMILLQKKGIQTENKNHQTMTLKVILIEADILNRWKDTNQRGHQDDSEIKVLNLIPEKETRKRKTDEGGGQDIIIIAGEAEKAPEEEEESGVTMRSDHNNILVKVMGKWHNLLKALVMFNQWTWILH